MNEAIVFTGDFEATPVPLNHPWQWCVGSDHATTALRADWQQQLAQAKKDLGFRYVRFHGILDDDMGTLICQNDEPLYSFFNTDRIFDFLLSIDMKPVVELSFMPRTLSSGNDIVFHYQGNITPPKDYTRWGELICRLMAHWVERYGIEEVSQWPMECWNEPNLPAFWTGDQASYFKLYKTTADAIKSVDKRLQVGGPASAGNAWIEEFLAFCKSSNTPVDFVSTHYYPTDPFGAIDTDTTTQLEHSPKDVMRTRALESRSQVGKLPLYYTEWSISSNPRDPFHDSSFAAALATRIAMSVDEVADGYSYWTFTDIFEENYFPSVPFHGGFGMMNLYGIPKPIYRAFEMIRSLGNERLELKGGSDNVIGWMGRDAKDRTRSAHIVLINQAMPRHDIRDERVTIRLKPPANAKARMVSISRVDDAHANPEKAWKAMGSPEYLKPDDVHALKEASSVKAEPVPHHMVGAELEISFVALPQSVNCIRIEWSPQ